MTSADTEAMTALQELLDERQRYEGWIGALEQRKSTTAPHVYSRVHTDYTLRLERVLQRLSERTEQLQSTMQLLASRLDSLRSRESDRIDALQEAELRAAVGEYADEKWVTLKEEAEGEIASIAEERRAVEGELAEIEHIVEMTRTSRAEITGAAPTAVQGGDTDGGDVSISESIPPSIQDFVADRSVRQADSPSQIAVSFEAHEEGQSQTSLSLDQLQSRQPDAPAAPALEQRRDNEKTLKCPECGGLNYATEWYCERCGGELATF